MVEGPPYSRLDSTRRSKMPMIDVTSAAGTFADKPALTKALAEAMMRWEKVPPIDFFSANTAAFVHELPPDSLSNARGDANYIRVEILTPVGILDREKKLGAVRRRAPHRPPSGGVASLGRRRLGFGLRQRRQYGQKHTPRIETHDRGDRGLVESVRQERVRQLDDPGSIERHRDGAVPVRTERDMLDSSDVHRVADRADNPRQALPAHRVGPESDADDPARSRDAASLLVGQVAYVVGHTAHPGVGGDHRPGCD